MAPGDFGIYSHDLLVGQFGSGKIAAYDPPVPFLAFLNARGGTTRRFAWIRAKGLSPRQLRIFVVCFRFTGGR